MVPHRSCLLIKLLIISLFCLTSGSLLSQNKLDSLLFVAKTTNSKELAKLQNEIAFIYYENGNIKNALEWSLKSLELAQKYHNEPDEAKALKTIGMCERFKGNTDKAFELFKKAAELNNKINDKAEYASCLSQQAFCYYQKTQITQAIEYYTQAIKIYEEIKKDNAALLTNTGLAYKEIGLYDKAFELFIKALQIDEKAKDTFGIAADYTNMAIIYIKQNKLDIALDYYKKAYLIFKERKNKVQVAILSGNIGATYFQQKNNIQALKYLSESLTIRRELNNPLMIANMCNSIGDLYIEMNDHKKAFECFNEALQLSEKIQSKKPMALAQLNLGVYFKRQKNYTQALLYLDKSSIIASAEKIYDILPDVYLNISDVWAFKNDFRKSLEYFKRYTAIKDTIAQKAAERTLFEFQTRHETTQKEKEITVLKNENKLIQEKNVMKNIVIAVSLLVIIILLLLAYTVYRLYNEKKLANEILLEEFKMVNEKLQAHNHAAHSKGEIPKTPANILRFMNTAGTEGIEINCNDLLYISALENYLEIIWLNQGSRQKSVIRNTMKNMEPILSENNNLVRCHRSFIVNLTHIKQVTGKSQNYKIELNFNNEEIPISRNYSKDILTKINASFGQ